MKKHTQKNYTWERLVDEKRFEHTESQIKPKGAGLIYLHKRMQWMEGFNYLLWDGDKTKYKQSLERRAYSALRRNSHIESVSKQQENLTVLDRYGCWAAELHTLHHASVKTRERGKMSVSHPCIWTDRWKPKPRVTALWFPWTAPTDLQKTHLYVSTDASQFVFSLRIRIRIRIPSLSMRSCILCYADKTGNYFVDGKL